MAIKYSPTINSYDKYIFKYNKNGELYYICDKNGKSTITISYLKKNKHFIFQKSNGFKKIGITKYSKDVKLIQWFSEGVNWIKTIESATNVNRFIPQSRYDSPSKEKDIIFTNGVLTSFMVMKDNVSNWMNLTKK